jgi:SAM domain (Sterile alpha motif)
MKKPSRAGGKPVKARSSKAWKLKRNIVPKAAEDRSSATRQLAHWLETRGLRQYAPRFAENDVTFDILRDLTDQDLKELGVASLGHRRQLLRAIAELNEVKKGPPKAAHAAERRQVTVMFSDLVGSTALSSRNGPSGGGPTARKGTYPGETRRVERTHLLPPKLSTRHHVANRSRVPLPATRRTDAARVQGLGDLLQ